MKILDLIATTILLGDWIHPPPATAPLSGDAPDLFDHACIIIYMFLHDVTNASLPLCLFTGYFYIIYNSASL